MAEIVLSNGKKCIVDQSEYDRLAIYKWHAVTRSHTTYAYRAVKKGGKQTNYLMHREIIEAPKGTKVDHKNGNGLDNQRSNLRIADQKQQSQNSTSQVGSTSKYKGVSWHTSRGKWRAVIKKNGKSTHLAYSDDEVRAARIYDTAASRMFGEFACLNFPRSGDDRTAANV